jgi:hypothetical protein
MEMKKKRNIQQSLKKELELLAKRPLTTSESFEAYFNLSGFIKVLNQMKKEVTTNGNI